MNDRDPWRRAPTARAGWSLLLLLPCSAACITLPSTDKPSDADSGAVADDGSYEDYVGTYVGTSPGTVPTGGSGRDTAQDTGMAVGGSGGGSGAVVVPPDDSGGSGTSVRRAAPAEAPPPVRLGPLPKPRSAP